jgi:hypothetical protein
VCVQRKNECARGSRMCSGSRTRRGRAEAGAGTSAACMATAVELGQRQCDVGNAGTRQHKVGRAAARPGSDAWDRWEAGGGAGVAATASGGEEQLGQTAGDMARQGKASARPGSGGADAGAVRGRPQGGSGVGKCTAHGWQSSGGARQKNRGEGERGRRRRTQLRIAENTGTPL